MKIFIPIPVHLFIVWLEVNVFRQKTYLPEIFTSIIWGWYIYMEILWKLTLGTKTNGIRKDFM